MWPIVQANRSSQGKGNGCKGTVPSAIRSGNPWVRRCSAPLFFGSPTTSCLWNTSQAENDNKNLKGEERIPLKNWLDIYIYICIYVLGMLHACRERAPRPRLSWNCCRQTGRDKTNPLSPYEAPKPQGVLRVSSISEHWLNGFLWRMAMDLYVWVMDSSQFWGGLEYFGKHILVHLAT